PQPPQFAAPLATSVSQPSVSLLLLQSAEPGLQAPLQTPAAHVGLATLLVEHAWPQPPQLILSAARAVSQPSVSLLPLQSAKPAAQAPVQAPPVQATEAMWLFEQANPRPPQLAVVVVAISQPSLSLLLLQSAKPAAQAPLHRPPP